MLVVGAGALLLMSRRAAAATRVPRQPVPPVPPPQQAPRQTFSATVAAPVQAPTKPEWLACLEPPGGGRIQTNIEMKPVDRIMVQAPDSQRKKEPLHRSAALAYLALVEAARKAGVKAPFLELVSGYRSDAEQTVIWKRQVAKQRVQHPELSTREIEKKANKWAGRPGTSNHRSGRTVDLNMGYAYEERHFPAMKATLAHQWLVSNASSYGFYPYLAEPWHWEYNPACA